MAIIIIIIIIIEIRNLKIREITNAEYKIIELVEEILLIWFVNLKIMGNYKHDTGGHAQEMKDSSE